MSAHASAAARSGIHGGDRREGAADDRTRCRQMNGELVRNGRVLDVGDALRGQQRCQDVSILSGLAGGKRRERADRQAEIEPTP